MPQLKPQGGRIELGSVAGGRVDLVEVANGFSFDYSGIEAFQDISLSGTSSAIDASGNGGGNINIAGRNITLADVSQIEASTLGDEAGGVIDVFATDEISISGIENENNIVSAIVNQVYSNATAEAGDINIEAGSLSLGDLAGIFTFSSGQANAGNITINASDSVSLESQGNPTEIASSVAVDAVGNGGDIEINAQNSIRLVGQDNRALITSRNSNESSDLNAGNITLNTDSFDASNGLLLANNSGQGSAGNISIDTSGDINLSNNSVLSTSGTNGNSGDIEINANSLTVSDSLIAIFSASLGTGSGGDVAIDTTENIFFSNSSSVTVTGTPGGIIDITAKNLSLTFGSTFVAGTKVDSEFSDAISGDIAINLSEDLILDTANNNETFTSIENSNRGQGNTGNIIINARNISLLNGAEIISGTLNDGNIGDIILNVSGDINIDSFNELSGGSEVIQFVGPEATGNLGEIRVSAQNLTLINSGGIQSSVAGNANSGDVDINIADTITIDGLRESTTQDGITIAIGSTISSEVTGVGDSGDINIETQNLFISREGNIGTNIFGQGNGGDIKINANEITLTEVGDISSEAIRDTFTDTSPEANAGNITINTDSLLVNSGSKIETDTSATGNAGSIIINATDKVIVDGTGTFLFPERDDSGNLIPGTLQEVEIFSRISSGVSIGGIGNGGNVEINTPQLSVTNEGEISTNSSGQGNAGSIFVNADEFVRVEGEDSLIRAGTRAGSTGNGGNFTIQTNRLSVVDGAQISTSSSGQGNSGNLIINANESIELNGDGNENGRSGLFAGALIEDGNGGNLQIFTQDLIISDGATINVSNFPSVEGSCRTWYGRSRQFDC